MYFWVDSRLTITCVDEVIVLAVGDKLCHAPSRHFLDGLDVRLSSGCVQVEICHQLMVLIAEDEAADHSNDQDQGQDYDAGRKKKN